MHIFAENSFRVGMTFEAAKQRPQGNLEAYGEEIDGWLTQKIERSIAFMEQNYHRPLQISALAAQANVSTSHFFALFKRLTGRPPMSYFTRLKMRRACELFGSTPASVKEVAAAVGYNDPLYFSRVFKSVHNISPSRYRALHCGVPANSEG